MQGGRIATCSACWPIVYIVPSYDCRTDQGQLAVVMYGHWWCIMAMLLPGLPGLLLMYPVHQPGPGRACWHRQHALCRCSGTCLLAACRATAVASRPDAANNHLLYYMFWTVCLDVSQFCAWQGSRAMLLRSCLYHMQLWRCMALACQASAAAGTCHRLLLGSLPFWNASWALPRPHQAAHAEQVSVSSGQLACLSWLTGENKDDVAEISCQ